MLLLVSQRLVDLLDDLDGLRLQRLDEVGFQTGDVIFVFLVVDADVEVNQLQELLFKKVQFLKLDTADIRN